MDPLIIAIIVAVFTLIVLFSGIPIAFGLSFVSIVLLVSFEGFQMLDVFAETFSPQCASAYHLDSNNTTVAISINSAIYR